MKRTLIVKEPKAKIKMYETHVEISTFYETQYVGFEQITSVYLNRQIKLSVGEALRIARRVPLYFIDRNGNILGKICIRK